MSFAYYERTTICIKTIVHEYRFNDLIKLKLNNIADGVGYAIISVLLWGLVYFFKGLLVAKLKWFLPIIAIQLVAVLYLLTQAFFTKEKILFSRNKLFILIGILEGTAVITYGMAISLEYNALIAPIISTIPMVTVTLARIFLKEILDINQKFGIISIFIGLILLSV